MNKRIQIWMSHEDFLDLIRLLENKNSIERMKQILLFENEDGIFQNLFKSLEEAQNNNSNWSEELGGVY